MTLSTGTYRLDFFELLLCMAAGQIIIGNPFYGAAVYLFADIVKAYILCNISRIRHSNGAHYVSRFLLMSVCLAGISVAFIYPVLTGLPRATYVSLFALCLVFRDYLCSTPVVQKGHGGVLYYVYVVTVQLIFDLFCAYLIFSVTPSDAFWLIFAVTAVTGIYKSVFPDRYIAADSLSNKYEGIASYRIFSSMSLYSTIAMNLGIMMFFCYVVVSGRDGSGADIYLTMALWLLFVNLVLLVCALFIKKRWRGLALAEFIFGAITWLLGAIFMFRTDGLVSRMIWTVIWGVGIALISSAIFRFNMDFEAVGCIADDGLKREDLAVSNTIIATVASIISSAIMLVVMALWAFVVPEQKDADLPLVLSVSMLQLPILFMLIALVFAFKQPLDYRNREKLMLYIQNRSKNDVERENLQHVFVRKYRMRFGVRILCTLLRPFLRLHVSGTEHLMKASYPSVFVSNHGFINGPIAAVIYLPTYFRPWIHNVMLEPDSAYNELSKSLKGLKKYLGSWAIRLLSKMTCWALNSFNPIPVVRGASKDVITTFTKSIEALGEGDNILIFPERPNHLVDEGKGFSNDSGLLRTFYTGFAHLGKMYFDKTGKSLLFYPLYSDTSRHRFKIGIPVRYKPDIDPRESKKAVAEQLQERMTDLMKD